MRRIVKQREPPTLAETRRAWPQHAADKSRADEAFNKLDKKQVRLQLIADQGALCAYCMCRIHSEVRHPGAVPFPIAHRVPRSVDPGRALDWSNLLGSCDTTGSAVRTCDAAQGETPITIDPVSPATLASLRYETRVGTEGLFIVSANPSVRTDVEETLNLNAGDLPVLRERAWDAFREVHRRAHPRQYGKPAWRKYLPDWLSAGASLPEFAGVIEAKVL